MQLTFPNWIRASATVLLALSMLAMCPSTPAQEPQIDALAEQMAAALSHAKVKSVIVFDFVGPDQTDALGQRLAADFRTALARAAHSVQVEDHSQLLEILQRQQLAPGSIRDAVTASWFLRQAGVDAAVLGTLSNANDEVKVKVQAFRVKNSDPIAKFETSIPLTDDLRAFIGEKETGEFALLPRSGKNGYSSPSCIRCPQSSIAEEAAKAKFQGTVLLELTVTEDGHARDIRAKIAMPDGLTDKAIRTVQGWTFKPARGPDGKPAAVRQTVEITFHLY